MIQAMSLRAGRTLASGQHTNQAASPWSPHAYRQSFLSSSMSMHAVAASPY